MLRKEIVQSIQKVIDMLKESSLIDKVLLPRLRGTGENNKNDTKDVLTAFAVINEYSRGFGELEKKILSDLDLTILLSQNFWSELLGENEKSIGVVRSTGVYSNALFAQNHLPKIITILERENDNILETKTDDLKKTSKLTAMSVFVIEDDGLSTPERLILMLESIQGLYDASSQILGLPGEGLSVLSCDSGSDKSFDFLGAAQIMATVKEIIIEFWNKLIYYKEDKSERHLELIANSLPILERIADMKAKNKLEPERAELLRRQIMTSVGKFSKAGVTIPELDAFSIYNPRQLMKPEPKLLLPPSKVIDIEEPKNEIQEDKTGSSKKKKRNKNGDNLDLEDPEFKKFIAQKINEYKKSKD